jgi:hypothetical protein
MRWRFIFPPNARQRTVNVIEVKNVPLEFS